MLRLSQNLLLGLLFLLQGIAPLVHAHPDGPGTRRGIHVDGLSEALLGAGDNHTNTRAREDESPGIGMGTPKRNDDRAMQPVDIAATPLARPAGQARPLPPPLSLRVATAAHPPDALRPAPRAPPHLRQS
jgi:hypothetical protein